MFLNNEVKSLGKATVCELGGFVRCKAPSKFGPGWDPVGKAPRSFRILSGLKMSHRILQFSFSIAMNYKKYNKLPV